MGRKRASYCPWNGCGMPNGAMMPHPVICKVCGFKGFHLEKYCTHCHTCQSCGRIIKKFYLTTLKSMI